MKRDIAELVTRACLITAGGGETDLPEPDELDDGPSAGEWDDIYVGDSDLRNCGFPPYVEAAAGKTQIAWKLGPNAKNHTLVEVNVAEIERLWKKNSSQYIGPGDKGIQERRESLMKSLSARPVQKWDAPEVGLVRGVLMFDDGRHRTAVMRDLGAKRIGLAVTPDTAEAFIAETGAKKSRSPRSAVPTPVCDCRPG